MVLGTALKYENKMLFICKRSLIKLALLCFKIDKCIMHYIHHEDELKKQKFIMPHICRASPNIIYNSTSVYDKIITHNLTCRIHILMLYNELCT